MPFGSTCILLPTAASWKAVMRALWPNCLKQGFLSFQIVHRNVLLYKKEQFQGKIVDKESAYDIITLNE